MKLSELIKLLEDYKAGHGDLEVFMSSHGGNWGKMREDCINPRNLYRVTNEGENSNVDPFDTRGPNTEPTNIPALTFDEWHWRYEDNTDDEWTPKSVLNDR